MRRRQLPQLTHYYKKGKSTMDSESTVHLILPANRKVQWTAFCINKDSLVLFG